MKYFANATTQKFLISKAKKVFLYGGYDDPNNFGDIIQLKGVLNFYKHNYPHMEPVIFLSYRAFKDEQYIEKLTQWFDCEHFVFQYDGTPEVTWNTLQEIEKSKPVELLHIYGGGYINATWGGWHINQIGAIIETYKIKSYIFSGHQFDSVILPDLYKLFKKKLPEVIGVRDRESLSLLKASKEYSHLVYYSFDDVTEIFRDWTSRVNGSLKGIVASKLKRASFAVHMNMAPYTGDEQHRNDITDALEAIRHSYPSYTPIVLHSYNERRPEFTKDSLGTIIELQEEFPYHSYSVINLAQMALDMKPRFNYYPDVRGLLDGAMFGLTCSYHTSMLLSYLSKPTFLVASNDYYQQKRRGLGYPEGFGEYLESPTRHIRNFKEDIESRQLWIAHLKEVISGL